MKHLFLLLFSAFVLSTAAQSGKQLKAHKKAVAESAQNGTSVVSLDTLFCSGKSICVSRESVASDLLKSYRFYASGTGTLLLSVDEKQVGGAQILYTMHFHPLGLTCDYTPKPQQDNSNNKKPIDNSPIGMVCYYQFINSYGLDTLRSELFYTVNGNKQTASAGLTNGNKSIAAEKTLVAKRDTTAPVLVEKENISQGGVLIGSFELDSIEGPGGQLMQYTIFNSVGAMVCTATCTDPVKGYWSFLTYHNNRFHTATLRKGDMLTELVRHLTRKGIL